MDDSTFANQTVTIFLYSFNRRLESHFTLGSVPCLLFPTGVELYIGDDYGPRIGSSVLGLPSW